MTCKFAKRLENLYNWIIRYCSFKRRFT